MTRFRGYAKLSRPAILSILLKRLEAILAEAGPKVVEESSTVIETAGYSLDLFVKAISTTAGWRAFQHDMQHTGRTDSPPSVIFVVDGAGNLHALSPDGAPMWVYNAGASTYLGYPVAIRNWAVYINVITQTGQVYLYSIGMDGSPKWSLQLSSLSSPDSLAIGDDGTIYMSGSGVLYAINLEGTVRWTYAIEPTALISTIIGSPVIGSDGTIYVAARTSDGFTYYGYLYAINPDGTLKWRYLTGTESSTITRLDGGVPDALPGFTPTVGLDGTIYLGDTGGYLHAVNTDGTLKWQYSAGISSVPTVGGDGTIYFGGTALTDTYVYALNPDGTLKWQYSTGDVLKMGSPAIGRDGTIYVNASSPSPANVYGYLYALNPDGTLKWRYDMTTSSNASAPAVDGDGTVYLGDDSGIVYAFNPDGTLKWTYNAGAQIMGPPVVV